MKRTLFLVLALLFPVFSMAKVDVVVSIIPQKYFVKKIARDLADVTVMVVPGANPATYEPKPSQMKKIARADLYFSIGVPFEKAWLPRFRAQNPKMKIVDITEGIKKVPMQSHHHHHDRHHLASSLDPHVWLSPPLVKILAENITKSLQSEDPAHSKIYAKNLAKFEKEIDMLDEKLKKTLEPCRGRAMMVFHPSWGYFARTYGLRQIPIEIEGKEPKSKELIHLIHEAKEEGVDTLFVQPQFSQRTARIIAKAIGASIVPADPLAENWSRNLLQIAKKVARTCQKEPH
ncbi:metal ABC transporter solute-binding protein, Zn/Mn family [Hydrogenimonas sp.]